MQRGEKYLRAPTPPCLFLCGILLLPARRANNLANQSSTIQLPIKQESKF